MGETTGRLLNSSEPENSVLRIAMEPALCLLLTERFSDELKNAYMCSSQFNSVLVRRE